MVELDSRRIGPGIVVTADLANDSVSSPKIIDGAVGSPKIALLAVKEGHLAADAVTGAKIKDGAVADAELAVDAVTTTKIVDDAISSPKIASPGIARIYHGTASGSPAIQQHAGAIYFCTDTGYLGIWDGSAWKQVAMT